MCSLAPALALSLAVGLMAGCSQNGGETTAAPTTEKASSEAEGTTEEESGEGTPAAEEEAARDTLTIATADEPPSMTTNQHNAIAGNYMNTMTHNGLFKTGDNMEPVPDLVESYENTSDTEWIFHLKQGVLFHNGEEMKAEDVKASLELCQNSLEVSQYAVPGTIEVVDDYTVKITTDGPQSGLISNLAHHGNFILPADLIESGHDFNEEPIGTGPYKLVAWNRVEAGEVDLVVDVETTDKTRIAETEGMTLYSEPGTSHNFLTINNEVAPFDNINFRKAIASAIDKDAVVQVALNGDGTPVNAMVPDCFEGTTDEGAPTYDVEQAKAYLEESGLDPAECGFTIICSDEIKLRSGQVIQSSLKENLGVEVQLESMDLSTYLDAVMSGNYEAALGGFTSSDFLGYVQGIYHSDSINASNLSRTNDPHLDELIEAIQAALDPEERIPLVTELSIAVKSAGL